MVGNADNDIIMATCLTIGYCWLSVHLLGSLHGIQQQQLFFLKRIFESISYSITWSITIHQTIIWINKTTCNVAFIQHRNHLDAHNSYPYRERLLHWDPMFLPWVSGNDWIMIRNGSFSEVVYHFCGMKTKSDTFQITAENIVNNS